MPGRRRSDPDHIAFETLNTMLGGNFVSRLNMNLREDKHWSYGVGSRIVDAQGPGPFYRDARRCRRTRRPKPIQELSKELRDVLAARPPTDAEIAFARNSLTLALPGNNETADEVAGSYMDILTYHLPDTYWNDYVGEVNALTPAQLQAAAAKLVQPECDDVGDRRRPCQDRRRRAQAQYRRGQGARRGWQSIALICAHGAAAHSEGSRAAARRRTGR